MVDSAALTNKGRAVKAMLDGIVDDSYDMLCEYFKNNPEEPYCLWGRDAPISIEDSTKPEVIAKHTEIEDMRFHTRCMLFDEILLFYAFCPRLQKGIKEMIAGGATKGGGERTTWHVKPSGVDDNYIICCTKK